MSDYFLATNGDLYAVGGGEMHRVIPPAALAARLKGMKPGHYSLPITKAGPVDEPRDERGRWVASSGSGAYGDPRHLPSSVPGIGYAKTKVASSKYFDVIHTPSGKVVASFSRAPTEVSDKEFIARMDSILAQSGINWMQNEAGLAADAEKAKSVVNQMRDAMQFNHFTGRYNFGKYSADQPRDHHGRWTVGGTDWQTASTLERIATMAHSGDKTIDLCRADPSFCEGNKGVPRAQMPQLSGHPLPGSQASKIVDANGKANILPYFQSWLTSNGYTITPDTAFASDLKPTQNQLNGAEVAGIASSILSGAYQPGAIMVSRDNYILDGHHRWAGTIGAQAESGNPLDPLTMPVLRVSESIGPLVRQANSFARQWGIPQEGVAHNDLTKVGPVDEPRDNRGQWTATGSSIVPGPGDEILYHGTQEDALNSILKQGLLPRGGGNNNELFPSKRASQFFIGDRAASVYLTNALPNATAFAAMAGYAKDAQPLVLKIDIPADHMSNLKPDEIDSKISDLPSGFHPMRYTGAIPPNWITGYKFVGKSPVTRRIQSQMEDAGISRGVRKAGQTVYATIFCKPAIAKFDPNEARDQMGRWASAGSAFAAWINHDTVKIAAGAVFFAGALATVGAAGVLAGVIVEEAARQLASAHGITMQRAFVRIGSTIDRMIARRRAEIGIAQLAKADDPVLTYLLALKAALSIKKFDPSEPRDQRGRWVSTGNNGDAGSQISSAIAPTRAQESYYHGTSSQDLQSILENGLVPRAGKGGDWLYEQVMGHPIQSGGAMGVGRSKSVYITENLRAAEDFANLVTGHAEGGAFQGTGVGGDPLVLKVEIPYSAMSMLHADEASARGEGAYRFQGAIKPEWIKGYLLPTGTQFHTGFHADVVSNKADSKTVYIVVFDRPVTKYDPNEPRDSKGMWTTVGNPSSGFKSELQRAYNNLPPSVKSILQNSGTTMQVAGKFSDAHPELAGVRPTGYPPGATIDNVAGGYNMGNNSILFAEMGMRGMPDQPTDVFYHETGHALDLALGLSSMPGMVQAWNQDIASMSPSMSSKLGYFMQPVALGVGKHASLPRGLTEVVGEAFANRYGRKSAGSYGHFMSEAFPRTTKMVNSALDKIG